MGTPDFSVPSLDLLNNHPLVELSCVVSMPDKKAGRGHQLHSPEVVEYCKKNKIKVFQTHNINKEEEFKAHVTSQKVDCFIVLAFAQFLTEQTLLLPKLGAFNIHTSILPKFRGAAPIQYALLNNEKETGVSIQKMVKKMDAGDIVEFEKIYISETETGGQLYTKLKYLAAITLNRFIHRLIDNDLKPEPQDEHKVSFAPTLKREDGLINFENETAEKIYHQVRAFYPWPGTYCFLNQKRLKVLKAQKTEEKLKPLEVKKTKDGLLVGCKEDSILLIEVQLEGKKAGSSIELINGIKEEILISSSLTGEKK